jgi:hypothetical protein
VRIAGRADWGHQIANCEKQKYSEGIDFCCDCHMRCIIWNEWNEADIFLFIFVKGRLVASPISWVCDTFPAKLLAYETKKP